MSDPRHRCSRKHLPYGYLTGSYFPLLVHPSTTATMIVPSRFWDASLLEMRAKP